MEGESHAEKCLDLCQVLSPILVPLILANGRSVLATWRGLSSFPEQTHAPRPMSPECLLPA